MMPTQPITLTSVLTCPVCQHAQAEQMPTDACQLFYECTSCHTLLKPPAGDCCVYCSYGSVPCPPIQEQGKGACGGSKYPHLHIERHHENMPTLDLFAPALIRWKLIPDGPPLHTTSSTLLPVQYAGQPAMLKIAHTLEEQRGAALMVWWAGQGAARVLAHAGDALLLERIDSPENLAALVACGRDDDASRIICATAAQLHAPRTTPQTATLVPLATWFAALEPASIHGGVLPAAAAAAHSLLATPQQVTVLHGDLHHGNVLDAGPRGWLAIDPKGLVGERAFDFANLFCNPGAQVPTAPGRLLRQVSVVAQAANVAPERLLQWILAYAGLSAAWLMEDNDSPALPLAVAQLAAEALNP